MEKKIKNEKEKKSKLVKQFGNHMMLQKCLKYAAREGSWEMPYVVLSTLFLWFLKGERSVWWWPSTDLSFLLNCF